MVNHWEEPLHNEYFHFLFFKYMRLILLLIVAWFHLESVAENKVSLDYAGSAEPI